MRVTLELIIICTFVLGVLIFIHELGHFIIAKLLRIKVKVFSLGMGNRLFGFKWKETDYRVSLIPLGGYVRLAGEYYEEHDVADKREFLSRSKFQRFLVLVMGSTFNILLCIILMTIVYTVGIEVISFPEGPFSVSSVMEGSPAEKVGIQPGDKITKINQESITSYMDFKQEVALSPNRTLLLEIERGRELIAKEVKILPNQDSKHREGYLGIVPKFPPIVGNVLPNSAAEKSGIQKGDRIVEINGQQFDDFNELENILSENFGQPLIMVLERNGEIIEVSVVSAAAEGQEEKGITIDTLGIMIPTKLVQKSLPGALLESLRFAKSNATLIFVIINRLLRAEFSLRIFSGPIEIAKISRDYYRAGLIYFISLIAMISLNLGVINLMPIPALDGGHILILFIEAVIRRDLNSRVKEIIIQMGLVFLILLMATIIIFDIIKSIPS